MGTSMTDYLILFAIIWCMFFSFDIPKLEMSEAPNLRVYCTEAQLKVMHFHITNLLQGYYRTDTPFDTLVLLDF